LSCDDPDARIEVRPAGIKARLTGHKLPSLAEVRRIVADAGHRHLGDTSRLPLTIALNRHATIARGQKHRSYRALDASCVGFVESFQSIGHPYQFIGGWSQRPLQREQAVMLVAEGHKYPGSLVTVGHARSDLPEGAQAFFGVIHCEWQARSNMDSLFLFLCSDGDQWLRANRPLALGVLDDAKSRIHFLRKQSAEQRLLHFESLIRNNQPWALSERGGAALGLHVGIDAVFLVPGFGAFFDGWLLSAKADIVNLQLRIDGVTLDLDPTTLRRIARPDLAHSFPGALDRTGNAGTVAVLRGALPVSSSEGVTEILLRVSMADGHGIVLPVEPMTVRRIDPQFDLERLERLFPAMEHEPWLDEFAQALRQQVFDSGATVTQVVDPLNVEQVVLWQLPVSFADLSLVMDELLEHVSKLPESVGLALILTPLHPREQVMRWVPAIRNTLGRRRLGVMLIESERCGFYRIEELCQLTTARSFAFVGPEVCLTSAGWRWLGERFGANSDGLAFMNVQGLRFGRPTIETEASAFFWHAGSFAKWLQTAPFLPGGDVLTHGLPSVAQDQQGDAPEHACRLRSRDLKPIGRRVNQALLLKHRLRVAG
jgi:hypothetical protein